jgi:hypothetical protein
VLQDDDEADTVGCCSLKVEHVTLIAPSSLQVPSQFLAFAQSTETIIHLGPVHCPIPCFQLSHLYLCLSAVNSSTVLSWILRGWVIMLWCIEDCCV